MLWLLVLHICAVALWVATLFYLPVLLDGGTAGRSSLSPVEGRFNTVERLMFTHVATPAALVAIMSGTVVFLINRTIDGWLIVKLSLVAGLVICHALLGLRAMRAGDGWREATAEAQTAGEMEKTSLRWQSRWLLGVLSLLVAAILWVVLSKPPLPLAQGG